MSTLFPASDSTFRLFVSTFQFRPCLRIAWLGDLTTYLFPSSWYGTEIASKGTPILPLGSAFRRITHASITTILVLAVPPFGCLSFTAFSRFRLVASVSRSTV